MVVGSSLLPDNFLASNKYDFRENLLTRTGSINAEARSNSGKKYCVGKSIYYMHSENLHINLRRY